MAVLGGLLWLAPAPLGAADCSRTSVGLTPLSDLGAGLYLQQFEGGLYPGGANTPPAAHQAEGIARAFAIEPLAVNGNPDPDGKYVLVSIGMSNTAQEFCRGTPAPPCNAWTFMGQAAVDPDVEQDDLVIINGARGGQSAAQWESPTHENYDRIRDNWLTPMGVSEAQVQVAWVKVANPVPTTSLPDAAADAYTLLAQQGNIARAIATRYPNIKIVFFSSRIYGGYSTGPVNPEPYAYEGAFGVKWLIEAQIEQMVSGTVDPIAGDLDYGDGAPWLAWGPYLWADGLTPRSDGLTWACSDFEEDGTHPAEPAETLVGALLLDWMLTSPFSAPWFRSALTPTVATQAADGVTATAATLNASVNPNGSDTDAGFEYGLTTGYGTDTATTAIGSGTSPVPVAVDVTGLTCGTEYHFRATATNGNGSAEGADQTFTTASCGPQTLTVALEGGGGGLVTSNPAGIDCGADCTEDYPTGQMVTLVTSATAGSVFAGWNGPADCFDGEVVLDSDVHCAAAFEVLGADLELTNLTFDTTETFEVCGTLSTGGVLQVVAPGELTLRAGAAVVLGNGLEVGPGALFSAELDPGIACP